MDWVALLYTIACLTIILLAYILQRKKTKTYKEIFDSLVKIDPLTTSFCLGKTEQDHKTYYRNVYIDSLTEKLELYPVDMQGQQYTIQTHGAIKSEANGFSIVGIDTSFPCPSGFSGLNCNANPICSSTDADGLKKRITYSQFHAMNLYSSLQSASTLSTGLRAEEGTHPKLYAVCDGKGSYTLNYCNKNQILDENDIHCVNYNFCKDVLNGYKYTDDTLERDQYYMCVNGEKEMQTCAPKNVFSTAAGNCVSETKCSGNDGYQEKESDTSYMQCENEKEVIYTCPDGIYTNSKTGVMSCLDKNCQTFDVTLDSPYFDVVIQHNECTDNIQTTIDCDTSVQSWQKVIQWNGINNISLPAYPKQQFVGISCIDINNPRSILKTNANFDMRIPNLMQSAHTYSLNTSKYICNTSYTNDYERGVLWQGDTQLDSPLPVNLAVPCIDGLFSNPTPGVMSLLKQLDDTYYSFLTCEFYWIDNETYWPDGSSSTTTFKTPRFSSDNISIETYNSQDFKLSHTFSGFSSGSIKSNTVYFFVQGETMNNIPEHMTSISSQVYYSIKKVPLQVSGDIGYIDFDVDKETILYSSDTVKISVSKTQLTITINETQTMLQPNIYFLKLTDSIININKSLNIATMPWDNKTPISYNIQQVFSQQS